MGVILGWKVAIIYTIVTTILSIVIGFALEAFGFEKYVKNVIMSGYDEKDKRFNIKEAFKDTVSLMKSVFPYLLIGAAIGSIINGLVPTEWISNTFGSEHIGGLYRLQLSWVFLYILDFLV